MLLNIVTLTHNSSKHVQNLANSLIEHCGDYFKREDAEWILRDNGEDRAGDSVGNIFGRYPLRVIKAKNEGNFSSMHNDLIPEIKNSKYTLLLNDDTIAENDFITPMLNLMKNDEKIGAVGAKLSYPDGMLQHYGVVINEDKTPLNLSDFSKLPLATFEGLENNNRHFQAVTGACIMFKTEDFLNLKGFDDGYDWCFDDVDLCLQIRNFLHKDVVYCKDARMIHVENQSLAREDAPKLTLHKSKNRLLSKWGNILQPDAFLYRANYGLYK